MEELINALNELCGTNGCTTYKELAEKLNVSYYKVKYWCDKYYKNGLVGVIYPGLCGVRINYIYNKCCTIK